MIVTTCILIALCTKATLGQDNDCKNLTCLLEATCPNLEKDKFCDGQASVDCANDEEQSLCQDMLWAGEECLGDSMIRCFGHRPGQCFDSLDNVCDGVYHCIDRSDEDECFYGRNELQHADNPSTTTTPPSTTTNSSEEGGGEKRSLILATLLFMLLGIPLTWLIKRIFMKWFVKRHAKIDPEQLETKPGIQSKDLITDDDVVKMLEFICVMVNHVEGDEPFERHKAKLSRLFNDVHETPTWSDNARVIYDMGHLLFDSKLSLIDEFHTVMYQLESEFHSHDSASLNLCLKHDLGNRIVDGLLWTVEPPGLRKLQKCVPEFLQTFWRLQWCITLRTFFGLFMDALVYYFDFAKDWLIFAILYKFIDKSDFFTFEFQCVVLLGIFLVVPEILRGMYCANKFKLIMDVEEYKFSGLSEDILKLTLVLLSPFIPAVLLLERGKMSYDILQVQNELFFRIEKCMNNPREKLEKSMIQAFKADFAKYHSALLDRERLWQVLVDTTRLEASTETIFQYILQLFVVLVVKNSSRIEVTAGLEKVFYQNKVGALLYLSITLSFISLINSRVKVEAWSKREYFRGAAKLQYGAHSFFALLAKVFSIVLYFAPSMGLFRLGDHYRMETIPFKEDFLVDTGNRSINTTWTFADSYSHYTLFSLGTYYVFFLLFVLWQCIGIFILKKNTVKQFSQGKSLPWKMLHSVICITWPSIYRDWDRGLPCEDLEEYERRFREVCGEHKTMTIWHCAVNIVSTLPSVYAAVRVLMRHSALSQSPGYFAPTQTESMAAKMAIILACTPAMVLILAFIQYRLLHKYYRSGHPWSRILLEFPSEKAKKGKTAKKTQNEEEEQPEELKLLSKKIEPMQTIEEI